MRPYKYVKRKTSAIINNLNRRSDSNGATRSNVDPPSDNADAAPQAESVQPPTHTAPQAELAQPPPHAALQAGPVQPPTHAAPQAEPVQTPTHHEKERGSPDTTVAQGILAFRSITTMLSRLGKPEEMNVTTHSDKTLDSKVRQELRILVALACVLVRNHEVVSVAALRPQEGDSIQKIACSVAGVEQLNPPQMRNDEKPKSILWSLFTTGNHRRQKDRSNGSLGVRNQDTPFVPTMNLNVHPHNLSSLRERYITQEAYVQFNAF